MRGEAISYIAVAFGLLGTLEIAACLPERRGREEILCPIEHSSLQVASATRLPIKPHDGHVIETMAQAAGLMTQRLPNAPDETGLAHAAALLMEAHASGKPDDLQHATAQLRRALDAEGWAE